MKTCILPGCCQTRLVICLSMRVMAHRNHIQLGSAGKHGRNAVMPACIHQRWRASVDAKMGLFSIVMSAAYEDDIDEGETFVYTGTGGKRDSAFGTPGPQIADQDMEHPHNASLKKSMVTKRHVRVVRGPNPESPWAPLKGYRYDGLYSVTEAWEGKGRSGYKVCKFRFVRVPGQPPLVRRSDAMPKRAKKISK
ncbi:hypothetical protein MVEN_02278600 [Mycena venus]|uniref:YDG domain-containing protein n=1 Tax=Mycena venus TaxID=2733690 RepID=A0A8H6X5F3_9AGAR|nr:hypothetical protein MVEN_02278600 [Mycena venus]